MDAELAYVTYPRARVSRRLLCAMAACAVASLASSTYAIYCGITLSAWEQRSSLPALVHPLLLTVVGAATAASATLTAVGVCCVKRVA